MVSTNVFCLSKGTIKSLPRRTLREKHSPKCAAVREALLTRNNGRNEHSAPSTFREAEAFLSDAKAKPENMDNVSIFFHLQAF